MSVTLVAVAEKEHPASIAGRYVRAAGIAIHKELERRAAEAAQRKAAEAQADAAQVAATPAAPHPSAPSPAAAAPPKRARRTPVTAPPPSPFLDRLLYWGFLLSLVATFLVALNPQMVASGSVRVGIRIAIGVVLLVGALPLLTNWRQSKQRLVGLFFAKFWGLGPDATLSRTGRVIRRVGWEALTLVGIVWLALGVYELLRSVVDP
jgi:hypothetical protein